MSPANGRAPALDDLWQAHVDSSGAADAVYLTVRQAIALGRLRPGEQLAEEGLARQFGISRTPVREAFLRLEAERLGNRIPRRGLVIRGVSEQELLEHYDVRTSLEGLSARLAAKNAEPSDHSQLRLINQLMVEAAERGDIRRFSELSFQFHEVVCQAARNGILLTLLRQVLGWARGSSDTIPANPDWARQAIQDHQELLEAIQARDLELAESLARAHISHALQSRMVTLRAARPVT